jgi:hypothetical protein
VSAARILFAQANHDRHSTSCPIKPNRTNQGIPLVVFQPGGRMIAANVNIRQVILVAYGIENLQTVDAPDWTTSERFANRGTDERCDADEHDSADAAIDAGRPL